ncbi:hypothetical protein ALTERO38_50302 [Alteromonas sp. 38]|uniref:hypothetical protein n=1 Tax=Alteromonas TaxID=226 RepID=UPI0012F38FAA|nr:MULTISPECIES: hypothetical protein [Alteromonas]CAD5287895.1 hypothetical protein ALTER154_80968 [Alteromonas sp. 154]VXB28003.1 hypothetical protein ALTERO38_50302 [Alteromonas sp. 38]
MKRIFLILSIFLILQGCSESTNESNISDFSERIYQDLKNGKASIDDYVNNWEKMIILKPYDNSKQVLRKHGVDNDYSLDFADIEVRDDITLIAIIVDHSVVAAAEIKRNVCDLAGEKLVFERSVKPLVIIIDDDTQKCLIN